MILQNSASCDLNENIERDHNRNQNGQPLVSGPPGEEREELRGEYEADSGEIMKRDHLQSGSVNN